jgi:RNA recognition motif-containing protein
MQEMNKKQLSDGQFLIVNKHVSKKDNELVSGSKINPITQNLSSTFNSNIYVKFIPNDVTEDELRKTFAIKDSNIVSLKLSKCVKKFDGQEV